MFFNYVDNSIALAQKLQEYKKLEIEIKELTGFNLKCLRKLFAMGYTLKAPDYEPPLNQMVEIMEEYD